LTSTCNSPCNTSRMPSSDTSDFSITSVRFLLEMTSSPSFHDTCKTFTFGNTNNINKFVLTENLINSNFLFKVLEAEVNFFSNIFTTIDLDLKDVVFLLAKIFHKVHLSVTNNSNDCAIFFNSVKLSLSLFRIFGNLSLIVRESFSL